MRGQNSWLSTRNAAPAAVPANTSARCIRWLRSGSKAISITGGSSPERKYASQPRPALQRPTVKNRRPFWVGQWAVGHFRGQKCCFAARVRSMPSSGFLHLRLVPALPSPAPSIIGAVCTVRKRPRPGRGRSIPSRDPGNPRVPRTWRHPGGSHARAQAISCPAVSNPSCRQVVSGRYAV